MTDPPRNPTGWMLLSGLILLAGGVLSPSPHGLVIGGGLAGGMFAIAAILAHDSHRSRKNARIDAARSALPRRDTDPNESFARRRIED